MNILPQDFEKTSTLDIGSEKSGSGIFENNEKTAEKEAKQEKKTEKKNIRKKKERITPTLRKGQKGKKCEKKAKGKSSSAGKGAKGKQIAVRTKAQRESCTGKKGHSKAIHKPSLKSNFSSADKFLIQRHQVDCSNENFATGIMENNRGHSTLSLAIMAWASSCQTFSKLMDNFQLNDEKFSSAR